MKTDLKENWIKWTFMIGVLGGILFVLVRGINRQYVKAVRNQAIEDSIKEARSIEILKRAYRTGYIDTTGNGEGINVMVVDTNRY